MSAVMQAPVASESLELRSPRGTLVLLEPSFDLPLVDIEVVFRTGAAHDPAGKEGLTRATARMVRMGVRRLTSQAVEDRVDALGAQLSAEVSASFVRFRGVVLERNLEPFVRLLGKLLQAPAFRVADLERVKRETTADLTEMLDNDRALAARHYRNHLFGTHAYGRSVIGRPQTVQGLTRDDLVAHHRAHYVNDNMIIGVAGAVAPEALEARVLRHLDVLPQDSAPGEDVGPATRTSGRRVRIVDKPERTQTQILIGTLGIASSDPTYLPLVVANTVFGGTFTSRLMQEVRVKRGWSYGASSSLSHDRQPDAWSMYAFPAIGDAVDCIALELDLLERWLAKGVTARELSFAKGYLAKSHAFDVDTAAKRLDARMDIELLGFPKDFERNFAKYVKAVDRKTANQALHDKLTARDLSIVLVATADQVRSRLEKLPGVTEVEVVPYDQL